jgi:hemoglobin/transferrin/lactoferrin receptor protein
MHMHTRFCVPFLLGLMTFIIVHTMVFADHRITGRVVHAISGDPVQDAEIMVNETMTGTTTNVWGEFVLVTENTDVELIISHIGFEEKRIKAWPGGMIIIKLKETVLPMPNVTVTSLGIKQTVRKSAMPLQVMDQRTIQTLAPVTISDAVSTEPGTAVSRDGAWGSQINIRGLSRQKVVTLIDGNRIETASNIAGGLSLIDVNDVERIEVIKGAASVLYGSGALGGVVNIITRKNTFQNQLACHGSLISGYSSADNRGSGCLTIDAGGRWWTLGVSAMKRKADNVQTPGGALENSQYTDNNLGTQFGILLSENHQLQLNIQWYRAEDVGIPGGTPFPSEAKARYTGAKRDMMSLGYAYTPCSTKINKFRLNIFEQTIDRDVELSTPAALVYPGAEHRTRGVQLRLDWTFGSHAFIAGLDAWQRKLNSTRTKHPLGVDQVIGERPIPLSWYRSIGVFIQDEFNLFQDRLTTIWGARFDQIYVDNEETYQPEYVIRNGQRTERPGNNILWKTESSEDISYSTNLGFIYRFTDDWDATVNVARAFRSPTLEERYQYIALGAATYWGNPDLEPELGTFVDLGIRCWYPNLNLTVNGFTNSLTNLVVDQIESEGVYRMANIGEARLVGFDAQVDYLFLDRYTFYGSMAYIRGKDTQANQDLPEIPPMNGRLGLKAWIGSMVRLDASLTLHAAQNRVAEGETATEGFHVFDLYMTSRMIQWAGIRGKLILGVENLTNEAYRYHLSTYRGLIRLEPGRSFEVSWLMEL